MATFRAKLFKTSNKSGETIASQNYNKFIARHKADSPSGEITDPNVYLEGAELYLQPLINDPSIATKFFQAQADANALQSDIEDEAFTSNKFQSDLEERLFQEMELAVEKGAEPETMVERVTFLYDQVSELLRNEIESRDINQQPFDTLIPLQEEFSSKADRFSELFNDMLAGTENVSRENFGFFIQTNPDTGQIMSVQFDAQAGGKTAPPKGMARTNSQIAGIPVFLNTFDSDSKARLGDKEYDVRFAKDELGRRDKVAISEDSIKGIGKISEALQGALGVGSAKPVLEAKDIKPDEVSLAGAQLGAFQVPTNRTLRDSKGNFYFVDQEGSIFKGNKDELAQTLNVATDDIQNRSFFITQNRLRQLNVQPFPTIDTPAQALPQPTSLQQQGVLRREDAQRFQESPLQTSQEGTKPRQAAVKESRGASRLAEGIRKIVSSKFNPLKGIFG